MKSQQSNKKTNINSKTPLALVFASMFVISPAVYAADDSLETTVSLLGEVKGNVQGDHYELVITEGAVDVSVDGVITTNRPTRIEINQHTEPGNGTPYNLTSLTATLNDIKTYHNNIFIDESQLKSSAVSIGGDAMTRGTPLALDESNTVFYMSYDAEIDGTFEISDIVRTDIALTFDLSY